MLCEKKLYILFKRISLLFYHLVIKSCLTLGHLIDCRLPTFSMGFPRQKCFSGLPFPFPGDLSNSHIKPVSPALAGRFLTTSATQKAL